MMHKWQRIEDDVGNCLEISAESVYRNIYNEHAPHRIFSLDGDWEIINPPALAATVLKASRPGSSIKFCSFGPQLGINVHRHSHSGIVEIVVDDRPLRISLFGSWHPDEPTILIISDLPNTEHNINITIVGSDQNGKGSELIIKSLFIKPKSTDKAAIEIANAEMGLSNPIKNGFVSLAARQDKNIGDIMSVPSKHVSYLKDSINYDMYSWHPQFNKDLHQRLKFQKDIEQSNIIIGGGGLLGTDWFRPPLEFIRYSCKGPIILWGVGHNSADTTTWRRDYNSYNFSASEYTLVGVRDFGTRLRWVPCVSCMAPEFNEQRAVKRRVGFLMHAVVKSKIDDLLQINPEAAYIDNFSEFTAIINFILESEIIVTNSFHGVYWATLLKRRVIGIPTSSKFFSLKHPVPLADLDNWEESVNKAVIYDDALDECRDVNEKFSADVLSVMR